MPTKMRNARPARRGRSAGGRSTRGRGAAQPGGPLGMLSGLLGSSGRAGGRGGSSGGGLVGKAIPFVSGFLSGGDKGKRGRRRR